MFFIPFSLFSTFVLNKLSICYSILFSFVGLSIITLCPTILAVALLVCNIHLYLFSVFKWYTISRILQEPCSSLPSHLPLRPSGCYCHACPLAYVINSTIHCFPSCLHHQLSCLPEPSVIFLLELSVIFSEFCQQSFYLLYLFGHFLSLIFEFLIQSIEYFRCFSMFRVWPYSFASWLWFWVKFTLVDRYGISFF